MAGQGDPRQALRVAAPIGVDQGRLGKRVLRRAGARRRVDPQALAIERVLQCVASGGVVSSVRTTTSSRALERFALDGGPPVGDRAETERTVDELAQQFVFKNLVTRVVTDERGYQIRLAASAEDKRSLDILEHEARSIQIDELLREFALDRIGERYSTDRASLHQLFETELIDEQQAAAFARALEHYWADRPDEALLICLPRIEAVLRRWLDATGGVVYQPPRGHRPGRVLGLGDVLRGLGELATDEMADWLRFFRIALTEQVPGLNLRNRHVHGLAEQASKRDAAVVLRIAALLRLVEAR